MLRANLEASVKLGLRLIDFMSEHIDDIVRPFRDFNASRDALKEFLENTPLYVKLKLPLPDQLTQIYPDFIVLNCSNCRAERPFRDERPSGSGAGMAPRPTRISGIYNFLFTCTGCKKQSFQYWVFVHFQNEEWIQKVGQFPIWLPAIPKDIKKELGEDAELYQKALRNMNEGYGIGACAYFRRLLEKYINPLLQLLHDVRKENGAKEEELKPILEAIDSKDFATKARFAADIAPPVNPG